jgi:hypothetical protein
MMSRRYFFQTVAAPVIAGYASQIKNLDKGHDCNPPEHLKTIARRIQLRVDKLTPNDGDLTMREVKAIMAEECYKGDLVQQGAPFENDTKGRFWIASAVNPNTFHPIAGVYLYPSETEYTNGLKVRIDFKYDEGIL